MPGEEPIAEASGAEQQRDRGHRGPAIADAPSQTQRGIHAAHAGRSTPEPRRERAREPAAVRRRKHWIPGEGEKCAHLTLAGGLDSLRQRRRRHLAHGLRQPAHAGAPAPVPVVAGRAQHPRRVDRGAREEGAANPGARRTIVSSGTPVKPTHSRYPVRSTSGTGRASELPYSYQDVARCGLTSCEPARGELERLVPSDRLEATLAGAPHRLAQPIRAQAAVRFAERARAEDRARHRVPPSGATIRT